MWLRSIAIGVAVCAAVGGSPLHAQRSRPQADARTPWGDPDLQGVWTNETLTSFERPRALADKPFLTEEEARAIEQRAARSRDNDGAPAAAGDVGSYNQFWNDSGTTVLSTRQSSLVVEPADGRVPTRPEAEQARAEAEELSFDNWEHMSPWDRCITRGVPAGFFPAGYNNAYQFIQTPGYVVIMYEMIHAARVIPTNGRPHRPAHLRSWEGDSVGHWEGQTLVVDVTNFNGNSWIATNAAAGRIRGIKQSAQAHIVERFTRTAPDTILYEVTIDDPPTYTRPWKVSIPLTRDDSYQIYEYACHEGNKAVEDVLRGGRARDREGAARQP
jgi:hypothetical protein